MISLGREHFRREKRGREKERESMFGKVSQFVTWSEQL